MRPLETGVVRKGFCVIPDSMIEALKRAPENPQRGTGQGCGFTAHIIIPHYRKRIQHHYADLLPGGLEALCERFEIPFGLDHFGLTLDFDRETELRLFDDDEVLVSDLRKAIDAFGPVVMRNAHLGNAVRKDCQHNIFPNLRFHFDRGANQPTQISMYTRDCADPVQCEPRTSSTVFVANIVAHLQHLREANGDADLDRKGIRASYELFQDGAVKHVIGDIVLEQPWTAPTAAGEICVIDNRTVLHASYYRNSKKPGYPIGTRYLA